MESESLTLTVTPLAPPQHGLRLIGELDMATVNQFKAALETVSQNGPVTVDLSGLTFIDSTGLHAMMGFARSQNGSGPLILARPSATAKRALEIAGLEGHPGVEIS
jgi:anti-anti-sigma factor